MSVIILSKRKAFIYLFSAYINVKTANFVFCLDMHLLTI